MSAPSYRGDQSGAPVYNRGVPMPRAWSQVVELDFEDLGGAGIQNIVNGAQSIGGTTWTGVNVANASLFQLNANGLDETIGVASDWFGVTQTAPVIWSNLSDLDDDQQALDEYCVQVDYLYTGPVLGYNGAILGFRSDTMAGAGAGESYVYVGSGESGGAPTVRFRTGYNAVSQSALGEAATRWDNMMAVALDGYQFTASGFFGPKYSAGWPEADTWEPAGRSLWGDVAIGAQEASLALDTKVFLGLVQLGGTGANVKFRRFRLLKYRPGQVPK